METAIHCKVCKTPGKMRKEMAVLASLATSDIKEIVPKITAIEQSVELTTLRTRHIEGLTPTTDNLNCDLMHRLGVLAKKVHQIGDYQSL